MQRIEAQESDTPFISRAQSYHSAVGAFGREDIPQNQRTLPTSRSEQLNRRVPSRQENNRNTKEIPKQPEKGNLCNTISNLFLKHF